jgi:hypothetical protein
MYKLNDNYGRNITQFYNPLQVTYRYSNYFCTPYATLVYLYGLQLYPILNDYVIHFFVALPCTSSLCCSYIWYRRKMQIVQYIFKHKLTYRYRYSNFRTQFKRQPDEVKVSNLRRTLLSSQCNIASFNIPRLVRHMYQ